MHLRIRMEEKKSLKTCWICLAYRSPSTEVVRLFNFCRRRFADQNLTIMVTLLALEVTSGCDCDSEFVTMTDKASLQLQSIERISNLPMVCSTLSLTTEYYEKIKETNPASKMILALAEHSVQKAVQLVEPVAMTLENPLKFADSMVCSTMDFVESRLTMASDPPQKISSVFTGLPVQPVVECAIAVASYGVQKINHIYNKINGENCQVEDERDTEPDKCDRGTQTIMVGNVRDKVMLYSQK